MKREKVFCLLIALSLLSIIQLAAGGRTESAQPASAQTESASGPLGKYDPAITITVGRKTDSSFKFASGESFEKNVWIDEYKDALGIDIKYAFMTDQAQYDAKVNALLASGDIPDMMQVKNYQAQQMVDSDLVYDITELFDTYASPLAKRVMTSDPQVVRASKFNGRLMAIPLLYAKDVWIPLVWVRSDWMKKLGLSDPKTADDVINIARAFKNKDPDGNGKDDTIGIPFIGGGKPFELGAGMGSLVGFTNMYHAYKECFFKDASGKLAYTSIQPEMKVALKKLQDLFKEGIIDQEFATKDGGKVAQDIVAERTGIYFGLFWNPWYPLQDLRNKNPNAEWKAYAIPSADGKQVLSQVNLRINDFFIISKKCKHPEAIIKMLNLMYENLFGSRGAHWEEVIGAEKYKGIETFKYAEMYMEPSTLPGDTFRQIQATLTSKDMSNLIYPFAKTSYAQVDAFLNKGDNSGWSSNAVFKADGSQSVIQDIFKNDRMFYDEFYGAPGPVYTEKWQSLVAYENETFTKIIMNIAPIDEFDNYVKQWKKIGGDALTQEINDWYAKNK